MLNLLVLIALFASLGISVKQQEKIIYDSFDNVCVQDSRVGCRVSTGGSASINFASEGVDVGGFGIRFSINNPPNGPAEFKQTFPLDEEGWWSDVRTVRSVGSTIGRPPNGAGDSSISLQLFAFIEHDGDVWQVFSSILNEAAKGGGANYDAEIDVSLDSSFVSVQERSSPVRLLNLTYSFDTTSISRGPLNLVFDNMYYVSRPLVDQVRSVVWEDFVGYPCTTAATAATCLSERGTAAVAGKITYQYTAGTPTSWINFQMCGPKVDPCAGSATTTGAYVQRSFVAADANVSQDWYDSYEYFEVKVRRVSTVDLCLQSLYIQVIAGSGEVVREQEFEDVLGGQNSWNYLRMYITPQMTDVARVRFVIIGAELPQEGTCGFTLSELVLAEAIPPTPAPTVQPTPAPTPAPTAATGDATPTPQPPPGDEDKMSDSDATISSASLSQSATSVIVGAVACAGAW
mmetsp:Transcript_15295/g.47750  ORF Transcript_15295/g.47750 Transcript_15295/m.47750 type:complete len:460 (-) Transcript_15295:29-1408(-)